MDTDDVVEERTELSVVTVKLLTEEEVVDPQTLFEGTPDTTACQVRSNFFATLVADLPADVFD